ncbi:MAG: phosphatase PAP2 family protein, partial [Spirochaetia bacterium]|nr:phosphatase PAP2 family protein [Spirochaetia bacterium]
MEALFGPSIDLIRVLILSNYTNALLKWSFHGPRPLWLDSALLAPAIELSYGAPSGHAQNAVAVWGCLALSFQKRRGALFAGALVLAFLISFSRLYLAVHFPHDILFGWVAGAAVLYVVTAFESDVTTRMAEMHPTRRALAILFAAALLGVVAWGASSLITSIPDPEIWAANAVTRGAAYMP